MSYEIWKFKTDRFTVRMTAEVEHDLDLSFDDSGEVRAKIDNGEYQVFCAKCSVELDGVEIASDYLGQCIYSDVDQFRDHIGIGETAFRARAIKDLRAEMAHFAKRVAYLQGKVARGEAGRRYYQASIAANRQALRAARAEYEHRMMIKGRIGSYFSGMVRNAVSEARAYLETTPKLRAVA